MIYYDAVCVCLCVTKNHHFQFPSRPLGLAGFGRLWPSDDDDGDDGDGDDDNGDGDDDDDGDGDDGRPCHAGEA